MCAYPRINNGNFDALSSNSLLSQLVDLHHDVRRKSVGAIGTKRSSVGRVDDIILELGKVVNVHWPELLDRMSLGDAEGIMLGNLSVMKLD